MKRSTDVSLPRNANVSNKKRDFFDQNITHFQDERFQFLKLLFLYNIKTDIYFTFDSRNLLFSLKPAQITDL